MFMTYYTDTGLYQHMANRTNLTFQLCTLLPLKHNIIFFAECQQIPRFCDNPVMLFE